MFSSARRGQVEPLPALIALAVFALALSMYGTVLQGVPIGVSDGSSEATVSRVTATITEGVVVIPGRLDGLDGRVPPDTTVVVRADGRSWRWGSEVSRDGQSVSGDDQSVTRETHSVTRETESVTRQVLVQTPDGAVPGTLRVYP